MWVGISVQNILLGDGSEHEFDRLNLDFMPFTVLAFPHGNSKGEESVRKDVRHVNFAWGILIEPAMRLPCFPVAMPLGSVHRCSANRFPRRVSTRPRLWCTTAPFVPFFVCAMHIVALSACNSISNPAECEMRCPSLVHRRISQSRNGMVHFFRGVAGDVYSPTRRR